MTDTRKTFLLIIIILLITLSAVYLYYDRNKTEAPVVTDPEVNDEWPTETGPRYSFQYPTDLGTKYVDELDWPPQAAILSEEFSCIEAGDVSERAGQTETVVVDARQYCRTTIIEGAAGSIYTQYAYAFPYQDRLVIFAFSTRADQCDNYPDEERAECEEERDSLDIDGLVDRMAKTFSLEE